MPAATEKTQATAHFDADAVAASQQAPTLMVGRYLYRGRLLSIEAWLPYWERLRALDRAAAAADGDAAVASLRARSVLYRDYLRAVFPRRDFRFWAPDPVKHLMQQPLQVVEKTIAFFFTLQARATFGRDALDKATATTHGSVSPPSTMRPPAAVGG